MEPSNKLNQLMDTMVKQQGWEQARDIVIIRMDTMSLDKRWYIAKLWSHHQHQHVGDDEEGGGTDQGDGQDKDGHRGAEAVERAEVIRKKSTNIQNNIDNFWRIPTKSSNFVRTRKLQHLMSRLYNMK